MNVKKTTTWIIILLLSLALALTTIINPNQKNEINNKNIDSFFIKQNEIDTIINKIKKVYPQTQKITNINEILEKKIINHIKLNIRLKKIGLKCNDTEIIYTIKKSPIFDYNGNFSSDKYKKYIEKQKISEYSLQKNIKKLIENTKTNKIINKYKVQNTKVLNVKKTNIEQIKYFKLTKDVLLKNFKIKKDFINFEKDNANKYKIPIIYKIKYINSKKNNLKKAFISKKDINKKILNLITNTNKIISIKNKNKTLVIKNIKNIKQNKYKKIYRQDLINKYKKIKVQQTIKKYIKNLENNKNYIKTIAEEKNIFISPCCKKNNMIMNIKNNTPLKNKILIVQNRYIKNTNIKNNEFKKQFNNEIKNKKNKIKAALINKKLY